ncbi:MAG: nitroreductase [Oscillospiraceae bacterium]|nr:nitroreductase [Oscillospiraceae bacterium]
MKDPDDLIRRRRSVRTFDGRPLPRELLDAVTSLLKNTENPWKVPLELRLLEAAPNGLRSPVILGERWYAAAKGPKGPHLEEAVGFVLERFCLRCLELGLGTVLLAGTLNRGVFERVMDLGPEERMPVVTPVGFPAERMSVRERAMRAGIGADRRLEFGKLFFDGGPDRPLTKDAAGPLAPALEAVRLAPSAANRQPWRAVVRDGAVCFYLRRGRIPVPEQAGDLQRVDLGIALCHFLLRCESDGIRFRVSDRDPGFCSLPEAGFFAVCLPEPD